MTGGDCKIIASLLFLNIKQTVIAYTKLSKNEERILKILTKIGQYLWQNQYLGHIRSAWQKLIKE
jgi:hypothetical protein